MSDTQPGTTPSGSADTAPQQHPTSLEGLLVSTTDAVAVLQETRAVETMTESFEAYVAQYTSSFAREWEAEITAFEQGAEAWQAEVLKAQENLEAELEQMNAAAGSSGASPVTSASALVQHVSDYKKHFSGRDDVAGEEEDTGSTSSSTSPASGSTAKAAPPKTPPKTKGT